MTIAIGKMLTDLRIAAGRTRTKDVDGGVRRAIYQPRRLEEELSLMVLYGLPNFGYLGAMHPHCLVQIADR